MPAMTISISLRGAKRWSGRHFCHCWHG